MEAEKKKNAAVFLDRDGTINEEIGYLDRMEKLQLIPGSAEAIRRINLDGMKVVIITNQSGVARGLFDEAFVAQVHDRLDKMLRAEGASVDAFYFCPHHPEAARKAYRKICGCRKPAPGMILRAAEDLRIDPGRSYMVGDTLKDIEAGIRAGAKSILVQTGYGMETAAELHADVSRSGNHTVIRPDHISENLRQAVTWIIEDRKRTDL